MNEEQNFASVRPLLSAGVLVLALCFSPRAGAAAGVAEITSISSVVAAGYDRVKLADGTLKPEAFAFGNGGHVVGQTAGDSIDKMSFGDLVKILAVPLSKRNYRQADEPADAKLLIMVYWGTTSGTEGESGSVEYQNLQSSQKAPPPPPVQMDSGTAMLGPGAMASGAARTDTIQGQISDAAFDSALQGVTQEGKHTRAIDERNAKLLGYDTELEESQGLQNTVLGNHFNDMVKEVKEDRYFVVMMAYDFQKLWKDNKTKLLWVTRISIRQRGNDFGKMLPAMLQYASDYFGRDSHGLLRKEIREGHVEVGEPTTIGVQSGK